MLCWGLKTFNKLDTIEAQEKEDVSSFLKAEPLDPNLTTALEAFNTADPF
jgi:hypothetical protein